jgi:hypothetical protein
VSKLRCIGCGQDDELRMGFCFDCASTGELRAARRTVAQHLGTALRHLRERRPDLARFDLSWAWQRLTRTGDYTPRGYFEREYGLRLGRRR